MNVALAQVVNIVGNVLTLLIIADALMSFFVSPLHPLRQTLGRILSPLYTPLRKVIPTMGMMDFSPLILLLIIQVLQSLIINALL